MAREIEAARRLATVHTRDSMFADEVARAALERFVERISEASRRLDPAVKAREPAIPWSDIAGIGNVLRHNYDRVDPIILWNILTVDLPELADAVQRLLSSGQRPA
ncbi:MAG: HepT-like ribonuclease domain-containing protein [Geminicoccaceae bacterium]